MISGVDSLVSPLYKYKMLEASLIGREDSGSNPLRSTKHITVFFVGRTWDRFRLKGFAVEDRAEAALTQQKP